MSTWMVVEDEPDIYGVLLAMFEIWGIEGIAFVDGAEAVAWIEDIDKGELIGELPDLAIVDIRLPEIAGPDVGARLRKSPRLGQVAMVLITAYRLSPDEETQVKAHAQADALMYKPFPAMEDLRKALDQIIAQRKELTAAAALLQPAAATDSSVPLPPDPIPTPQELPVAVEVTVDSANDSANMDPGNGGDLLNTQIIKTEAVQPDPKPASALPALLPEQTSKQPDPDAPVESSVSTPPSAPPTPSAPKPQLN